MEILRLSDPIEVRVAEAVVNKAVDIDLDRRKEYYKNMAAAVQTGVAKAFGGR